MKGTVSEQIMSKAHELGFDVAGIAPAGPGRHADAFRGWLARGFHGDMAWLARDPERRTDPRKVLAGARSVICAGLSYASGEPPDEYWNDPLRGRIARYAWHHDYHDVLLPMLKELGAWLEDRVAGEVAWKAYVDTGPVLERETAARAGVGFIGKNTLLISPKIGSYMLLGVILTDAELEPGRPAAEEGAVLLPETEDGKPGTCGQCRRCQDICPTHAFPAPYILDSRLCISYLTIEHKTAIPEKLRPLMKNWIFGCDECQSVCPWVRSFSRPGSTVRWAAFDPDRCTPRLDELAQLDSRAFNAKYKGYPMARTRRKRMLRNVAIALGNSARPDQAIPALEKLMTDPEPLIREHAEWAVGQLKSRS